MIYLEISFKKLLMLLVSLLFLQLVNAEEKKNLTKLVFMSHWLPQAQFAGYYMAKEFGIYEKYGLDVTILNADTNKTAESALKNNEADIVSLFLATGIKMRADGVPVVNICQISQKSALVFVAKKSSGILKPVDMNGKKLGLWKSGFQEVPQAFLNQYNLNTKIVPIASGINLFLWDGIDIITVMWYNEYHLLIASGLDENEFTPFFFSENNLNILEDGLYCKEDFYNKDPEVCKNFVKATMEGWKMAFKKEDEVMNILSVLLPKSYVAYNRSHQTWMLRRMKDIIMPPGEVPGILEKKEFEQTAEILYKDKMIGKIPEFERFYINLMGK